MDYKRIYDDFIKDRRTKEAGLEGYRERHHIVPRSLGGGNEPENLIDLTPEDHFFAHLLLAKVHGGRLASAVQLLADTCNGPWRERFHLRARYGLGRRVAARLLSEAMAGEANHLFNAVVYEWANYRSGQREAATLYEMHRRHGASRGSWTQVAKGERPSIRGWTLAERLDQHVRSEKGQKFSFVNRDGRRFTGTQAEFCQRYGICAPSASRIVRAASVTLCGWRLEGTPDRSAGAPKDGRRSAAVGRGRTYHLRHRDGRRFAGTAEDFRLFLGKPEGFTMSVRLSMLVRGAAPTLYGWAIEKTAEGHERRAKLPVD